MPFVRYARDRRGYETLYVMHAFETGGEGRPRPRVLYACRSVPYARVGRAPLDESVQRRIATAYPHLDFDWPRLLKEAAASAPRPEKPDKRDEPRKGRGRDRERKPRKDPARPQTPQVSQQAPQALPAPSAPVPQPDQPPAARTHEPDVESIGPLTIDPSWPAVSLIGETGTLVLRGRYIELAHRVLSRVEDETERRRLLMEAARLNPEGWRTDAEARAGIDRFDAAYDALAARLRPQPGV